MTWHQMIPWLAIVASASIAWTLPQLPDDIPLSDYYGGFFPTEGWAQALTTVPREQRCNPFQTVVIVDDEDFPIGLIDVQDILEINV